MITPALRLVISNICPTVPNGVIEDLMKSHGIKLLSRITYLRVGMPEAEYAHVLSFRRVVYIAPSEVTIPDTTTLSFEGTTYRIFLSTDGINCSYCQQPGHSQLQCPNKAPSSDGNTNANTAQQSAPTPPPNETQETPYTQITDPTTSKSTTENSFQLPKPTDINLHTSTSQQVKRQLPISPEITESNTINLCQTTAQTKKKKTSGDLEELLEPASDFINSPQNTTKPNITEIADYIENAQKSKDIITISKNYTDDLPELEKALSILHTLEKDRKWSKKEQSCSNSDESKLYNCDIVATCFRNFPETAKVSKLLLLSASGGIEKYKGKLLDDIEIDLSPIIEQSYQLLSITDTDNGISSEPDKTLHNPNGGSIPLISQKRAPIIRQPWTIEQKNMIAKPHPKKKGSNPGSAVYQLMQKN
nr:unnamed protein product [Callosobruchus analis]